MDLRFCCTSGDVVMGFLPPVSVWTRAVCECARVYVCGYIQFDFGYEEARDGLSNIVRTMTSTCLCVNTSQSTFLTYVAIHPNRLLPSRQYNKLTVTRATDTGSRPATRWRTRE